MHAQQRGAVAPTNESPRRAVLRGIAAASLGATAGCVDVLPPAGGRTRFGRVDLPPGDEPAYRRWSPAPSALPAGDDRSTHPSIVGRPASDDAEVIGVGLSLLASRVDYFGVGVERYDLVARLGPTVVLEGPVDPSAVGEVLTDSGYEHAGSELDYALYARDDVPRTVAVADGRLVFGRGADHREYLTAVLRAEAGEVRRLYEVDDVVAELSGRVGGRPFLLTGTTDSLLDHDQVDYTISGFDLVEDAVYWFTYTQYPPEEGVPEAELREELRSQRAARPDLYSHGVDLRTEGDLAIMHARITRARWEHQSAEQELPPQVTWGARETGDEVVLRHEAGDVIDAGRLHVATGHPEEPAERQFADEHDVVGPGTELAVPAPAAGEQLRVAWGRDGEEPRTTLFAYPDQ